MELIKSKKFQVMIGGIVAMVASHYGLDLNEDMLNRIMALIISYIAGQAVVDYGKETK